MDEDEHRERRNHSRGHVEDRLTAYARAGSLLVHSRSIGRGENCGKQRST
jgi:hypothetical protein